MDRSPDTGLLAEAAAAPPDEARQLAGWARAFEHKLQSLPDHLDPGWARVLQAHWPFLDRVSHRDDRRRLAARLFVQHCGGLPRLQRLLDPLAQLALLDRPTMLGRLCALALARRPGVLRCCVARASRQALQQALGPSFEPLLQLSRQGRPVSDAAAHRPPLHWACIGYADWASRLQPDDGVIRRVVRLSLPCDLGLLVKENEQPADLKAREALAALQQAGVPWPC